MNWWERNSGAVQAIGAVITALVAVLALIGVKFQVDASYVVQREQSAKEIYREFLNITIANPDFAAPDHCALERSPRNASYEAYVSYLLYTAEQVIDMDASWAATMESHMQDHKSYFCSAKDEHDLPADVEALFQSFKEKNCSSVQQCPD